MMTQGASPGGPGCLPLSVLLGVCCIPSPEVVVAVGSHCGLVRGGHTRLRLAGMGPLSPLQGSQDQALGSGSSGWDHGAGRGGQRRPPPRQATSSMSPLPAPSPPLVPVVALPTEKAEGRERPGQQLSADDGERAANREGPRGRGGQRLNIDVGLSPASLAGTRPWGRGHRDRRVLP